VHRADHSFRGWVFIIVFNLKTSRVRHSIPELGWKVTEDKNCVFKEMVKITPT